VGTASYTLSSVGATYNDRIAACPFQYKDANNAVTTACN
jgi:hypothetical protein